MKTSDSTKLKTLKLSNLISLFKAVYGAIIPCDKAIPKNPSIFLFILYFGQNLDVTALTRGNMF